METPHVDSANPAVISEVSDSGENIIRMFGVILEAITSNEAPVEFLLRTCREYNRPDSRTHNR